MQDLRAMGSRLKTSQRMEAVQTPVIPAIAALIRDQPGTLSLGQGVVSYGPPPAAYDTLRAGMSDPENHKYRPVSGMPDLVEAFWRKLENENGVLRDTDRCVMVTAGSNLGFMNAILAIADPGDEIILQTPYYFNHEMAITTASCKPVLVATDDQYQLRLEAIRAAITPRTRAVVTISPNNPTGAVYPEAALTAVNDLCRKHGLFHIHDEAYEYFTYGAAKHFSPASLPSSTDHTISLFSMSKGYGFASWRIGFMLAPRSLQSALMKIQDTLLICAPVPSQFAALGALAQGMHWPKSHLISLSSARNAVLKGLCKLGDLCSFPEPDGAFYVLARFDCDRDPMELATQLVKEFKVAAVPGTAFGVQGCLLRISYGALSPANAAAGIDRLVAGVRTLLKRSAV